MGLEPKKRYFLSESEGYPVVRRRRSHLSQEEKGTRSIAEPGADGWLQRMRGDGTTI